MKMTDYISQNFLRQFCYTNRELIKGDIKGVAVYFYGMNVTWPIYEPDDIAKTLAERGVLVLQPMLNPWAWMSDGSVAVTDRVIDVVFEREGLPADTPVCCFGGSMGGYGSYLFPTMTKHNIVRTVINSGPSDLTAFCLERDYTIRTLMSAFWKPDEEDFSRVLRERSPINMIDRMPKIAYRIYHCRGDQLVPLHHSTDFFEAAKDKLDVTFTVSETNGHCDLLPEDNAAYLNDVAEAFGA